MVASAEESHREVMQLIEVLSDSTLSETTSSIHRVLPGEDNSNSSVSLFLPSQPQIFHGREIEVKSIISQLSSPESLRIAILGPGGIGKSSLARVVLHHPVVVEKYGGSRFFVPCDSASSTAELASLVAAYIGLEAGSTKNAAVQVVQHLNKLPGHVLLVLDNLETVWELDDKKGTEDFLAGLAGLGHLGLMITMRGAERPAQVLWTRPFLQPLQPLSTPAAVQTFSEIADVDDVPPTDLDAVLRLTDNVPLAINLIAHLVDVEGIAAVLARWNTEGTGVVSEGWDKRTNLDRSIALSLTSPRLLGTPGAMELLSLLALLPDGLTNADLTESRLPLPEGGKILDCKSTLLRTSLAYITTHKRLKVLAPIREHLQAYHPASSMTVNALFASYYQLVELFKQYQGTLRNANTIPQIAESFANIQNTISFRIRERIGGRLDDAGRRDTVYCALHLNAWSHMAGNGALRVMRDIKGILASPVDHHLEVSFIAEFLFAQRNFVGEDMETLINKAVGHFEYFDDSNVKCECIARNTSGDSRW
ncbi:P-loop containing nucleoside triphosphate hydrolase protein [Mycena amicta]|nr:P-loop containing nucleoside triphosphate hydrolase protein [Mycena amicta]